MSGYRFPVIRVSVHHVRVHGQVLFEITILGESFTTLTTDKRLLPGVRALVHVQGALLDEALAADGTAIRLLSGVDAHVDV